MYIQAPSCGGAACLTPSPATLTRAERRVQAKDRTGLDSGTPTVAACNRMTSLDPGVLPPKAVDLQWLPQADRFLLDKALQAPFEYVDHPLFEDPAAEEILFGTTAVLARGSTWFQETERSLPLIRANSILDAEGERQLFLRFNFARMRAARIAETYRHRRLSRSAAQNMLAWLHRALMIRGVLAQANIRLVLSMAKRGRFSSLDEGEVLSAGNYALLRSIDRFDCSRGFKFSTYACQGIIQRILHVLESTKRHRRLFVSEYDETLERDDSVSRRHDAQRQAWVEELREVIAANRARLTALELRVIQHRYGLQGSSKADSPMTLKEIGEVMGVTKERVRQIQKRALEKLRSAMEQQCRAA